MVYKQCVGLTVGLVSLPALEIVLEPCRGRGLKLLERLICLLQVVRGCIGPILSLLVIYAVFVFRSFDVLEEHMSGSWARPLALIAYWYNGWRC